jgi:hypothetical protein
MDNTSEGIMTNQQTIEILIQAALDNGDAEELDRITRQLRRELLDLDVESVKFVESDASETARGSKAIDPVVLGALVVAVGPTLLTKFLEFLHAWAMRREGCTIKIKIQSKKGALVEVEVPATTSPSKVTDWINMLNDTLGEHTSTSRGKS